MTNYYGQTGKLLTEEEVKTLEAEGHPYKRVREGDTVAYAFLTNDEIELNRRAVQALLDNPPPKEKTVEEKLEELKARVEAVETKDSAAAVEPKVK